jgi:hypothetical protein
MIALEEGGFGSKQRRVAVVEEDALCSCARMKMKRVARLVEKGVNE